MDNLSDYSENALLEHIMGRTELPLPTNTYAALYTVAPTDAGGGTEVPVANGYDRQVITWGPAATGVIANSADIRFPTGGTASGAWGTIIAIGIFDQLTGGNLLFHGPLSSGSIVGNGDTFKLVAGALTAQLS